MNTEVVIGRLKEAVKAKGLSYQRLADELGLSLVTVKRIFSGSEIEMSRLIEICQVLNISPGDLIKSAETHLSQKIYTLSAAEDTYFAKNLEVYEFFTLLCRHQRLQDVERAMGLARKRSYGFCRELERLGLIELHAQDRVVFKKSPFFQAPQNGRLVRELGPRILSDFLNAAFDGKGEFKQLLSVELDKSSLLAAELILRRAFDEIVSLHSANELSPGGKIDAGVLLAIRPWSFSYMDFTGG